MFISYIIVDKTDERVNKDWYYPKCLLNDGKVALGALGGWKYDDEDGFESAAFMPEDAICYIDHSEKIYNWSEIESKWTGDYWYDGC